jgi:hypothetical protein
MIHFHLLDNVDVLKKLRKELEDAMPDRFEPAELGVVEKLPYLVRCVIIMKNTVDFYCCRMLLLTKV